MFDTLQSVVDYYSGGAADRHEVIYKAFDENVRARSEPLFKAFNAGEGFGEDAFCWNWELLISAMPVAFKFLEIGVYKGRTLGVVQLLSTAFNKSCEIYGISPLTNKGDKYSQYGDEDYSYALLLNLNKMGSSIEDINIIKGLSTDAAVKDEALSAGPYDIIYIDGCHDYEVVCADIDNYLPMLKPGGYLVMDDASLLLDKPYGRFLGHADVCRAIKDKIDGRLDMTHLFAVGHNRVWLKASL
jgi:hypothetical protein